jgi:hypothetical protein
VIQPISLQSAGEMALNFRIRGRAVPCAARVLVLKQE